MTSPNRFLRRKAVLAKVGFSSTHLFNLEKAGRFPQHIMLTPRCAVWSEAEIDAWMQDWLASASRPQVGASPVTSPDRAGSPSR